MGAEFAKWRMVVSIGDDIPSMEAIKASLIHCINNNHVWHIIKVKSKSCLVILFMEPKLMIYFFHYLDITIYLFTGFGIALMIFK